MKNILFLLIIVSFQALGSEPRRCEGEKSEINDMLIILAEAAQDYYEKNEGLPRSSWSHEMAEIFQRVPNSELFGNIDSEGDGHRIEMICSVMNNNDKYTHHIYHIDLRTFEISHVQLKEH